MTGASLGFLASLFVVFVFRATELLGLSGFVKYFPLVMMPLVWGLLWRYVVKHLNALVGLKEW